MIAKKSNMTRVIRLLEAFRQHHRDILTTEVLVFLHVAVNDGMQMSELQDLLGVSQAAVSRNVYFLSKYGANNREGLELIQLVEDTENRRRRRLYLTPKGKAFLRQLEVINEAA